MSGSCYANHAKRYNNTLQKVSTPIYKKQKKLSGPELAEHIFNVYGPEPCGSTDDSYEKDIDFNELLKEDEYGTQLELKLENPNELLPKYRESIIKYERAYVKLADYALQWYNLMEDINNNDQIEKMFKDLQMMRKLYGDNF
jgi:hypothetical protein